MSLIQDFLRDKPRSQRAMMAAIILNAVSQFFLYFNERDDAYMDYYGDIRFFGIQRVGTGWHFHPHAYILLLALAFVFFRDDVLDSALFRKLGKWGWWLAVFAIFLCTVPGNYVQETGGILGGFSLLAAIVSTMLHIREIRSANATPPPVTDH